jgi:uncharacterized protein (DUF305 family)
MHAIHVAMASLQTTGNNDVDFVRLMLPHHQAAIDVATTQLAYAKTPGGAGWRRKSSPTRNQKSS